MNAYANKLTILAAAVMAFFLGCHANNTSDQTFSDTRRITQIIVTEDIESWNCSIIGDQPLIFSAINQVSPTGLLFYFPDTKLDLGKTVYIPADNEVVSSIAADEILYDGTTTSRIRFILKIDRPYSLSPDEDGLMVSFPKPAAGLKDIETKKASTEKKEEPGLIEKGVPPATRLITVAATPLKNHIIVNLNADGAIFDYNAFVLQNPARIVFDIYNLKSPHEKEQIIAVASRWVKQIRYFVYADKIRLVLDTYQEFLTKYLSFPTDSGLLIYIGEIPAPVNNP